ncbi:alpha/beta hydrolase family protein [uncultured Methanobrevibacter sp.]|uniref:alpha/beta hydrolase n=1 Tax=uncultured Methanobrevibacter sp. TaxID=253161 RepID=UPI0025ED7BED|nr:alpha/beta hydrolase-fold protein [uncultured Methanobrevibacter sp.]
MALLDIRFKSLELGRNVSITVILPVDNLDYVNKINISIKPPYKTLYLLNGIYGDSFEWISHTNIKKLAEIYNLCVIMPSGENSFYRNHGEGRNYSNFIGQELLTITRNMFNLSKKRADTFIGGYSMGGFGALYNGLKYNHNFSKIVGLSPALILDYVFNKSNISSYEYKPSFIENCFGSLENIDINEYNPSYIIKNLIENDKKIPDIYLSCAEDDVNLINPTRRFKEFLEQNKNFVNYYYREGKGGHNWKYWDMQLEEVINWLLC